MHSATDAAFCLYFGAFCQSLRLWTDSAVVALAIGGSEELFSKVKEGEYGQTF